MDRLEDSTVYGRGSVEEGTEGVCGRSSSAAHSLVIGEPGLLDCPRLALGQGIWASWLSAPWQSGSSGSHVLWAAQLPAWLLWLLAAQGALETVWKRSRQAVGEHREPHKFTTSLKIFTKTHTHKSSPPETVGNLLIKCWFQQISLFEKEMEQKFWNCQDVSFQHVLN